MSSLRLRHAVRAVILDEEDRILLCRMAIAEAAGTMIVWVAPGGGVERDETPMAALCRELAEEVGLVVDADPPHVWHQQVIAPGHAAGYDGVVNDYFLVRTAAFRPGGVMSADELTAENIDGFGWWRVRDIADYRGPERFAPRDLASLLAALIVDGVPGEPVPVGL
jgi:ADP-ribose pyrophosphatase YjhB (NUDIX family)